MQLRQAQIGELLEVWSKEAGVTLTAEDAAASQVVVVYLEKRPLSEAMEALRALLSVRNAPAEWTVTDEKNGSKIYRLRLHKTFPGYAANMDRRIQQDYQRQARNLLRYAQLPDAELQTAAKSGEEAKTLADPRAKDTRAGLRFLSDTLNDEQIDKILQGSLKFEAKATALPPSFQTFVEVKEAVRPGVFQQMRPYTRIRVQSVTEEFEISPALLIYLGNDSGLEYNGYAGGSPLDFKWGKIIRDEWKEDGKSKTRSPLLTQTLKKPEKAAEMDFSPRDDLRQIAQGVPCSLLALCLPQKRAAPGEGGASLDADIYAKTLEEWLTLRYPMYKWSDETLLLNYPTWFRQWDKMPSYKQTQRLRQREEKQGWLYPTDFCAAARLLTDKQAEFLSRMDFPAFEQVGEKRALWASLSPSRTEPTLTPYKVTFPLTPEILAALPAATRDALKLTDEVRVLLHSCLNLVATPRTDEKAMTLFYFTPNDYGLKRDTVEKNRLLSLWLTLEREGARPEYLSGVTYPDFSSRRTKALPVETRGAARSSVSGPVPMPNLPASPPPPLW